MKKKKKKGKKLLDYFCNEWSYNLTITAYDECPFSFAVFHLSSNSLLARFLPNRFHLDVNIFSPISENKSLHVKQKEYLVRANVHFNIPIKKKEKVIAIAMHSIRNNFRRIQDKIYPSDLSRCKPIFVSRGKYETEIYEKAEGNCVLEKSVDYTRYASRYRRSQRVR